MSRLADLLASGRPLIMGILNTTPDSFSDGGNFLALEDALDHARRMIDAGADIIDIGGESTRPGAAPVSVADELARVLPVVQQLRYESDVAISVDTSKAEVMWEVLRQDIDIINDVCALQQPGAIDAVAASSVYACLMHMQGEPRTMQSNPQYEDVVNDVNEFLKARVAVCEAKGIDRSRVVLDVGFGFGKTPEHNLRLINHLDEFLSQGLPLLVGLSRKSTIAKITEDRLSGSLAGALAAVQRGAHILRVHDVAETVAAVNVWQSIVTEQVVGA